jgi:hypothetical protein
MNEHKHLLVRRWKDGKWVDKCRYSECDYEEEITPAKAWENEE